MKIFVLPILAIMVFCMAGTACADIVPQIVEFYPSGAKFVFAVKPGVFDEELPGVFQLKSVRPLNPGDAADFRAVSVTRDDWVPPALAGLKAQIEEQRRAVADLAARKAALEHSRDLLKSLRPKEEGAKGLLEYIQDSREMKLKVERELSELTPVIEQGRAKLKRLESEFNDRSPDNADVCIKITGTAKETLLVEAFTGEARWTPRYVMNLASATGEIETRMSARVSQHTGLDYSGPVVFHTKFPDETVRTPVLDPLRVGLRPKEKSRARNSYMADEDAAMPMMMEEAAMGAGIAEKRAAAPVMETTLADRAVRGEGAVSGDGRESELMLGEIGLKGTQSLVLIPEQRSDAWIVVEMEDVKTPLIPGNAELRIDGQPAGTTTLPEYGLGQKRIPFGYAPQVTVKKEPIVETKGSGWFSGVFTGGYTLEVTNGTQEERTVTVRDRLPIPTDDKVKLEVKRIEPAVKEQDPQNRLTWEVKLKPHETAKFVVDYTLSYPSGEELQYRR